MQYIVKAPGGGTIEWNEGAEKRSIPCGEPVDLSDADINRLAGLGFILEPVKVKAKEARHG